MKTTGYKGKILIPLMHAQLPREEAWARRCNPAWPSTALANFKARMQQGQCSQQWCRVCLAMNAVASLLIVSFSDFLSTPAKQFMIGSEHTRRRCCSCWLCVRGALIQRVHGVEAKVCGLGSRCRSFFKTGPWVVVSRACNPLHIHHMSYFSPARLF